MICIYTQGGKSYGLGHLSRIIPLYHQLLYLNFNVKVFLHGDELAKSYLSKNGVESVAANTVDNSNFNEQVSSWIIDCTQIWDDYFFKLISNCTNNILLSPKFNLAQIELVSSAFLRSDPFNLPIENKNISKKYFFFNKGNHFQKNEGKVLGLALSGADSQETLNRIVNSIINDTTLTKKVCKLKVFSSELDKIVFNKNKVESYFIDIEIISTLNSLWSYSNDIDLMIVGNGIVIDECIVEGMDFILYNEEKSPIKSIDPSLVLSNSVVNLTELIAKLKADAKKTNSLKVNRLNFEEIVLEILNYSNK